MSPVLTIDDRVTIPGTAFDHPGYRLWVMSPAYPEDVRTTYVEGEVLVEMSPESGETHNKVKTALTVAVVPTSVKTISVRSTAMECC
jgi:hypothetical protein